MDPLDKEVRVLTHRIRKGDIYVGAPRFKDAAGGMMHGLQILQHIVQKGIQSPADLEDFHQAVGETWLDFINYIRAAHIALGQDYIKTGLIEPALKVLGLYEKRMRHLENMARADGWSPDQGPIPHGKMEQYRRKTKEKLP